MFQIGSRALKFGISILKSFAVSGIRILETVATLMIVIIFNTSAENSILPCMHHFQIDIKFF